MLHKAICTVTGHPVDVPSGTFFTDEEDFWLDGPVPLSWERTWYSRSDYRGPLGNGWHHAYDMGVVADTEEGTLTLRMSDGIPVAFPPAYSGGTLVHPLRTQGGPSGTGRRLLRVGHGRGPLLPLHAQGVRFRAPA
ncbi:DUF6531 domain-containing protein [Parabacteroides distasonis]|nr:DUF6531 domain-containing protein [Parabacteroides distasonis]